MDCFVLDVVAVVAGGAEEVAVVVVVAVYWKRMVVVAALVCHAGRPKRRMRVQRRERLRSWSIIFFSSR